MISSLFSELNIWAVLVSVLAYYGLGAIWYNLFGTPWMNAIGKSKEELMQAPKTIHLYTFIIQALMVWLLAGLVMVTGSDTAASGSELGLIVGVCFIICPYTINKLYSGSSLTLLAIDAGYHTFGLIISSIILSVWK